MSAGRDSAPAVTVAAVLAAERDRNALVLMLAADHVIRKPKAFRDACRSAASAAAEGRIVTFGIEPTGPVTSYGYVRPGEKLNGVCRDRRDLCCRSLGSNRSISLSIVAA